MEIEIDGSQTPPVVMLNQPENFEAFRIVAHDVGPDALVACIDRFGRVDDSEHAFVDLAALKALAGPLGRDPWWLDRFDAMIAYAESKGWVASDGAVRAHIDA